MIEKTTQGAGAEGTGAEPVTGNGGGLAGKLTGMRTKVAAALPSPLAEAM